MTILSFRDVEQLSAFLDGQLTQVEMSRLEARIRSDPALASTLADLRQARSILHRTPKRRLPRNFTLTPKMAGIKPPVPRSVPALGWASAVAMLVFTFTLGANLLSKLSFGAAAPMLAAAPVTSEGYGLGGGPAPTAPSASDNTQITPTPETSLLVIPTQTLSSETRQVPPSATPSPKAKFDFDDYWPYLWLGLALVLVAAALLIRKASVQAFRRKMSGKRNQ